VQDTPLWRVEHTDPAGAALSFVDNVFDHHIYGADVCGTPSRSASRASIAARLVDDTVGPP
jgi:hypothetical protein